MGDKNPKKLKKEKKIRVVENNTKMPENLKGNSTKK